MIGVALGLLDQKMDVFFMFCSWFLKRSNEFRVFGHIWTLQHAEVYYFGNYSIDPWPPMSDLGQ